MQKKQSKVQENEEEKGEVIDLRQDFSFIPKGRHIYRQQGPYLVCRECVLDHASYIGIENIMVGEDEEGKPIIKKKSEVLNSESD